MEVKIGNNILGKGVKGDTGNNGADGLSAYEIAVNEGFVGTESAWLASLVGADGQDGVDGVGAATIVTTQTDNVNIGDNWVHDALADYGTNDYIDIDVTGYSYITAYDAAGTQSFGNVGRPQIIEFNISGTEIATQTSNQGEIFETDKLNWKKWKLNASTTTVRFGIPFGNSGLWGGGTPTANWLQNNYRITLGDYFTQETETSKIVSINDVTITEKPRHKLFGNTIAIFGDSNSDQAGIIGSRTSWAEDWIKEKELSVYNYATGSASLADWVDTVVVTDGSPSTVSHDNVISNQVEEMIASGVVPDIVIINGGVLDAYRSNPIGSLVTASANYDALGSQDKTTIYGVVFWIVKRLKNLNPSVQIFMLYPFREYESLNTGITATLQTIIDAQVNCVQTLGLIGIEGQYYLNNLGVMEDNPYWVSEHFSVLGKSIISPLILSEVEKAAKTI
jgi:hypothetical protein